MEKKYWRLIRIIILRLKVFTYSMLNIFRIWRTLRSFWNRSMCFWIEGIAIHFLVGVDSNFFVWDVGDRKGYSDVPLSSKAAFSPALHSSWDTSQMSFSLFPHRSKTSPYPTPGSQNLSSPSSHLQASQ